MEEMLLVINYSLLSVTFISLDEYLWWRFIENRIALFGIENAPYGFGAGYYLFFLWKINE